MNSSLSCFVIIALFFTSLASQDAGELVVLRSPNLADTYFDVRDFTCMTDDDDSAISWTWSMLNENSSSRTLHTWNDGFLPKKPPTKNNIRCAVWKAEKCIADWGMKSGWDFVHSTVRPMGPALDYRWEDFAEFPTRERRTAEKYEYVGKVQEPFRSITFSTVGEDIDILLCTTEELDESMCFRIILRSPRSGRTRVYIYEYGMNDTRVAITEGSHQSVPADFKKMSSPRDVIAWQTFSIEWTSEGKMVKIKKNPNAELRFAVNTEHLIPGSHVFVGNGQTSRVRFHFYQYLLTEENNGKLSTKKIYHYDKEFCVRLLVGLCPTCEMKIDLIDHDHRPIGEANIISGNSITRNGLLAWQPIKFTRHLQEPFPKHVHLRIQTLANGIGSKGQWAIDKFRVCKPLGELRNFTLVIEGESDPSIYLNCQKISYNSSTTVYPFSDERNWDSRTIHLQQITNSLERFGNCSRSSSGSCAGWSICTPRGCTCDRGFSGTDCNQQCDDGSYGYGCDMRCGSCLRGYCDKKTGYCPDGNCEDEKLLSPLCEPEPLTDSESSTDWNLLWLIILPIVAISMLAVFIWYRNRRKTSKPHSNSRANPVSHESTPRRLEELTISYVEPTSSSSRPNNLTTFQASEISVHRTAQRVSAMSPEYFN